MSTEDMLTELRYFVESLDEAVAQAENKLDGRHMASFAPVNGTLFIRSDKALYRVDGSY